MPRPAAERHEATMKVCLLMVSPACVNLVSRLTFFFPRFSVSLRLSCTCLRRLTPSASPAFTRLTSLLRKALRRSLAPDGRMTLRMMRPMTVIVRITAKRMISINLFAAISEPPVTCPGRWHQATESSAASSALARRASSPKYRARSQKRGREMPVDTCLPFNFPSASSPWMS